MRAPLAGWLEGERDWASVTVSVGSGTDFSLAMLNAIYLEHVLRPTAPPLRGAIVAGLNRAARTLDRRMPGLRDQRPDRIAPNYHVVADRAA